MKAGPAFDGLRGGTVFTHLSQYLVTILHSLQLPWPRAQLSSACGRVRLCVQTSEGRICSSGTTSHYLCLCEKNILCIGKTLVTDLSQHIFMEYSIIHLHRNKFPFQSVFSPYWKKIHIEMLFFIIVSPESSAQKLHIGALPAILYWVVTNLWPEWHLVFCNNIRFATYVYHKTHFIPMIIQSVSKL